MLPKSCFAGILIVLASVLLPLCCPSASAAAPADDDAERIADLVIANHILVNQHVLDGFGHVSVRSAKNPNHYFISRTLAPGLVTAEDIMEYDLNDHPVDARGRSSYSERFIHSEIYKARPDVQAVVHSHSEAVIPFSVSRVPLRPVSHMAGFLIRAVPVFEIRSAAGNDSDMLIRNTALGAAVARTLGQGTVLLLRGHGDVVVGQSLKAVVMHAIYTDVDARLESEALSLSGNKGGEITYLNEAEAAKIGKANDEQVERPWGIWKSEALAHDRKP